MNSAVNRWMCCSDELDACRSVLCLCIGVFTALNSRLRQLSTTLSDKPMHIIHATP